MDFNTRGKVYKTKIAVLFFVSSFLKNSINNGSLLEKDLPEIFKCIFSFSGQAINQKEKCFSMHIHQTLVHFLLFHRVFTMPQASLDYLQPTGQFISIYLLKTCYVPSTVNR